jgi:hypothetical protein
LAALVFPWSGAIPASPSVASAVPQSYDGSVVMCRVPLPAAWREADYETTELETVIQDLLTGQYGSPIRVVAFNTAERWSEMFSRTSPANCAVAAICKRVSCLRDL